MPKKRLSMRKIREVLRLKHELGRSHREIAGSLGIANSTVSDYLGRAGAAGFSWPLPEGLDDAALEAALFPAAPPSRIRRPEPDWNRVHRERQRHKCGFRSMPIGDSMPCRSVIPEHADHPWSERVGTLENPVAATSFSNLAGGSLRRGGRGCRRRGCPCAGSEKCCV